MNTKIPAQCLAFLLCLFTIPALASPPYRGPGGQIEAAGMIAGTYLGTTQLIEACDREPALKEKAQRTLRDYLHRNHQTYMDVMRMMPSLAKANGGDAEVQRLKVELEKGLNAIEAEVKKTKLAGALSVPAADAFLDEVNKGLHDLAIKNNGEVTKILK